MQVEKLSLKDLVPNTYNPNIMSEDKFIQLKKTIKNKGYWQFIAVRKHPTQAGKYEIIDGEHRWKAMKDESEFQEPQNIVVLESDDDLSKLHTIDFNLLRGELDSIKVANIIHEYLQKHTMEELEKNLGMPIDEIKNYDEMATFNFDNIADIDTENPSEMPALEQMVNISIDLNPTEFALYNGIKNNVLTNLSDEDTIDDKKVFLELLNRLKPLEAIVEVPKPEEIKMA